MTREVPVTQARADLAELVSRVGYSGERILLTRHGKALAALVPVSDLEELERPHAEIGFSLTREDQRDEPRPGAPLRVAAEHKERRGKR
jgi:prevent-host-death family protein